MKIEAKSVTVRNLVGGFLGGFLGILSSFFVTPVALPFSVLFGVLLGWWNENLILSLNKARVRFVEIETGMRMRMIRVASSISPIFLRPLVFPPWIKSVSRWMRATVIEIFIAVILSLVYVWRFFKVWKKLHPMDRVAVINMIVFILFIFGAATLMWFVGSDIEKNDKMGLTAVSLILAMCATTPHILRGQWQEQKDTEELKAFYRDWEIIGNYGDIAYFFYVLGKFVRYLAGIIVFVTVIILWFAFTIPTAFGACLVLVLPFILMRWLYQSMIRSGHWLCLGITMTVTLLSWFIYHERFADPRVLWAVALGTGVTSGAVTEGLRYLSVLCVDAVARSSWFVEAKAAMKAYIAGSDDVADFVAGNFIGGCFGHSRVARVLRAICFDSPVARPVTII